MANNMHPVSWGGGINGKDKKLLTFSFCRGKFEILDKSSGRNKLTQNDRHGRNFDVLLN